MNLLTFGLVGTGPLGDRTFFGLPLVTVGDAEVRAFGVEAHGPPATDERTLVEFDELVRGLAAEQAVIPHRFGVIAPGERIEADLRRNADVLRRALDSVEGRDEWTIRIRPRDTDVLRSLPDHDREQLRSVEAPIDRGVMVHGLITDAAARMTSDVTTSLDANARTVHTVMHDDALGGDVIALIERSADVHDLVSTATEASRRAADVELVGPGPAYRSAGRLTRFLRNETEPTGAAR